MGGAGLAVGIIAFTLYLRRRRSCSLREPEHTRRAATVVASAVVTYVALFLFTTYLDSWFGQA